MNTDDDGMTQTGTMKCPYCGQKTTLEVDTTIPSQHFWADCEMCLRQFEVTINCVPGEILSLDVEKA